MSRCADPSPRGRPRSFRTRRAAPTPDRRPSAAGRAGRAPAGVPRSATPGRRSIAAAGRRTSTRPRIAPGRAAARRPGAEDAEVTKDTKEQRTTATATTATPASCPLCPLCPCVLVIVISRTRTPVAPRTGARRLQPAAVAAVVLKRDLQQQVALDRIAAADLDSRHRRVPRQRRRHARQVAEAEMIVARRRRRGPGRSLYRPSTDVDQRIERRLQRALIRRRRRDRQPPRG